MIRFFDLLFSSLGLTILSPLGLGIALWIRRDSPGPVFYLQERIGKGGKPFLLVKFRTMTLNREGEGLLTLGSQDARVTRSGRWLRRYKLDELPQLFNVLKGEMSLVGPRPEVRKYVNFYTKDQRQILEVRPGITDYASIAYIEEGEILARQEDPEQYYIDYIMPAKIEANQVFIQNLGLGHYFRVIGLTLKTLLRRNRRN